MKSVTRVKAHLNFQLGSDVWCLKRFESLSASSFKRHHTEADICVSRTHECRNISTDCVNVSSLLHSPSHHPDEAKTADRASRQERAPLICTYPWSFKVTNSTRARRCTAYGWPYSNRLLLTLILFYFFKYLGLVVHEWRQSSSSSSSRFMTLNISCDVDSLEPMSACNHSNSICDVLPRRLTTRG